MTGIGQLEVWTLRFTDSFGHRRRTLLLGTRDQAIEALELICAVHHGRRDLYATENGFIAGNFHRVQVGELTPGGHSR